MNYLPDGPDHPTQAALDSFWAEARAADPNLSDPYEVRWFGIDAETTQMIFDYIKEGVKVGTFTLPWILENTGQSPAEAGQPVILIDYDGTPTLVLRILDTTTVSFGDIDASITRLDGPAVQDPAIWKPLHQQFWESQLEKFGLTVTDDMPVLVERFELVHTA